MFTKSLYFSKSRFVKSRFIKSRFIKSRLECTTQQLQKMQIFARHIYSRKELLHACNLMAHVSISFFRGFFLQPKKYINNTHTPPLFILKYVASPPPSNKKLNLDRPEVNSSPKFLNPRKSKTRPIELRI